MAIQIIVVVESRRAWLFPNRLGMQVVELHFVVRLLHLLVLEWLAILLLWLFASHSQIAGFYFRLLLVGM